MKMKSCGDTNIVEFLCMKGTSDIAATTTTPAPSPCTTSNIVNNKRRNTSDKCTVAGGDKLADYNKYNTIESCCDDCQYVGGTNAVMWKKDGTECYCQDKNGYNGRNCDNNKDDSNFKKADCSCAKKRKREAAFNETMMPSSITINPTSDEDKYERLESLTRHKRSIDTTKERKYTCETVFSGAGGYWDYEYSTPGHCFSK